MKICQKNREGPSEERNQKEKQKRIKKASGSNGRSSSKRKSPQNADDLYLETIHHPSRAVGIADRRTVYIYAYMLLCVAQTMGGNGTGKRIDGLNRAAGDKGGGGGRFKKNKQLVLE